VCGACSRWTLAPIEERWEALEELDRLARDRARLLSSTENVALMRVEDLEIVRVGRAERAEEAWWRYGRELTGRRKRSHVLRGLEVAAIVGASIATGGMFGAWFGHGVLVEAARWHRFGNVATRARVECPRCGSPAPEVRFRKM
jgi:anti-sigma factor RsiW